MNTYVLHMRNGELLVAKPQTAVEEQQLLSQVGKNDGSTVLIQPYIISAHAIDYIEKRK